MRFASFQPNQMLVQGFAARIRVSHDPAFADVHPHLPSRPGSFLIFEQSMPPVSGEAAKAQTDW